jgi:YVTN family beta-propeller protein
MSNELLPGTTIYDHYKISECISTADFSNIYIAEDLNENNKKVIIKELMNKAIGTNDRENALKKFQEEIETYKNLEHPNMAKVIECFSSESAVYLENKQFIIMEYVKGKTLRKIKEEKKEEISPDDAGKWFSQIIEAIKYLSEQNPPVIFYYLTPDHVMITDKGEVKLINFGLGRFFRTGSFKSNQYMGIAGYAAPEQYGIKPVDNRADIFGAGAIAYYMLTQDDPEKHALNFSPVRTLNPLVSMQFARFISKCVHMKAEDRFENINEVIEKLNSMSWTDTQIGTDKIKKKEDVGKKQKIESKQKVGIEVSGTFQNMLWTVEKYIPLKKISLFATIIAIAGLIAFLGITYIKSIDKFPDTIVYATQLNTPDLLLLDLSKKTPFKKLETGECKGKFLYFNDKLYVSGPVSNIIVIDTKKADVSYNITMKSSSTDMIMTKDGSTIYTSNTNKGEVTKIAVGTGSISSSISLGGAPSGMALSDNGHYLYVANFLLNNIGIIDTTSNTIVKTISNSLDGPMKLLILPEKNMLYCTNWSSNSVTIINTVTNNIVSNIKVGNNPNDIILSPDKKTVYISNYKSENLSILDTEANNLLKEIKLPGMPTCMSLFPGKEELLVGISTSNRMSNKIIVLDLKSNNITKEIPVDKYILSFIVIKT